MRKCKTVYYCEDGTGFCLILENKLLRIFVKNMLGIVFSIDICTRHRMSSNYVYHNMCAHPWHSVSVKGQKQDIELAVPAVEKLMIFEKNYHFLLSSFFG